jgi:hypothetical protein
MLSEYSAPLAMPETHQRDPVVRVKMSDLGGVMMTKHKAPIITQHVENEEYKGLCLHV